jgi:uncharacterized membrane protein YeaQ/YmgE (transglycosylase-associated protein family)
LIHRFDDAPRLSSHLRPAVNGFCGRWRGKIHPVLWFIVALVVSGLIVGALGRLIHPGPDPMGLGMTILIGIAANLLVGLVLHGALGPILSFILAVIVAALLVALWSRRTPGGRGVRLFGRL